MPTDTSLALSYHAPAAAAPRVDAQLRELSSLLDHLEPSRPEHLPRPATPETQYENNLAQVRLGMAASLFAALRCKHPASAAHSVRVALGCSAWALALELPADDRDAIELAALLHDVGKIGVPDRILLMPSALTADEHALMDRHRAMGLEILSSCSARNDVLDIVRYAPTWYDGTRNPQELVGTGLPLGARMLAIVDAFDSMTTPQVYRPAMSRERAIAELCGCAGTQFDPHLVRHFAEMHGADQQQLNRRVARRWLEELDPQVADAWWQLRARPAGTTGPASPQNLFQQKLLENMYDAVVFLDANLQVLLWNRGAERLTGISGSSMTQKRFVPSLLEMRDERGDLFADHDCPVAYSIHSGVQSLRRLIIRGRNGQEVSVDAHSVPVVGPDGTTYGASLLMHDASGEASLEQRCHSLYEQAIRDPLTQLANRAEFDRVHAMFVEAHLERRLPCSLIICDIDRFKQVNDNYGHQAGDDVIKSFSALLKSHCRPGDLVARYGGEEFVMLCADCNNATALQRAEMLRKDFGALPQDVLGGKPCTASFGVTEIQPGDIAETMLNRADRALLMAKEGGRNLVVQLGSGMAEEPHQEKRQGWWFWRQAPAGLLLDKQLLTSVPLNVTIEKLRGFVSDHAAEITEVDGNRVDLVLTPSNLGPLRRTSDRPVPLVVEIQFAQEPLPGGSGLAGEMARGTRTRMHVLVRPKKHRDRRRDSALEQAKQVVRSLRSYLMASEAEDHADEGVFRRAGAILAPWLAKK